LADSRDTDRLDTDKHGSIHTSRQDTQCRLDASGRTHIVQDTHSLQDRQYRIHAWRQFKKSKIHQDGWDTQCKIRAGRQDTRCRIPFRQHTQCRIHAGRQYTQ
jgi:hypothetical protein